MNNSRGHSSEAPENCESTNQLAVWDFRISATDLGEEKVMADLKKIAKSWTFQEERGDGGYLHYQGRISLIKKRRAAEKHILLKMFENKPNYLAPTANPTTFKGDMFYVQKEDTRTRGPWTDKDAGQEIYIPRQYRGKMETLLNWQRTIFENLNDFQVREINVIYDPTGNSGKSTCAALMELYANCIDMAVVNDYEKIIQTACNILMARQLRDAKAMFFDMPRAMGKERLYGFYMAIEQIKKGKVFDFRNHYKEWWFDSPQIWVFTNKEPELELQSRDRWLLWEIDAEKNLVKYEPKCKIEITEEFEYIEEE